MYEVQIFRSAPAALISMLYRVVSLNIYLNILIHNCIPCNLGKTAKKVATKELRQIYLALCLSNREISQLSKFEQLLQLLLCCIRLKKRAIHSVAAESRKKMPKSECLIVCRRLICGQTE